MWEVADEAEHGLRYQQFTALLMAFPRAQHTACIRYRARDEGTYAVRWDRHGNGLCWTDCLWYEPCRLFSLRDLSNQSRARSQGEEDGIPINVAASRSRLGQGPSQRIGQSESLARTGRNREKKSEVLFCKLVCCSLSCYPASTFSHGICSGLAWLILLDLATWDSAT